MYMGNTNASHLINAMLHCHAFYKIVYTSPPSRLVFIDASNVLGDTGKQ